MKLKQYVSKYGVRLAICVVVVVLIALSAFAGKNTLTWGMICVALGTVTSIILSARKKKEQ